MKVKKEKTVAQQRYSAVQSALSRAWRAATSSLPYSQWVRTSDGVATRSAAKRTFNESLTSGGSSEHSEQQPGPSHGGKHPRESSPPPGTSPDATHSGDLPPSDDWDFDLSLLNDFEHLLMDTMDSNVVDQPRTGSGSVSAGPTGGPRGSGTGASPLVRLGNSHQSTNQTFEFSKSRTMWSYAYATGMHVHFINKKSDLYYTPLSFIPVDFLPFYLTKGEYNHLPENCRIEAVMTSVQVLGVRSGFDTGATVSGTATAEYVPLLMTAIGLNNKFEVLNRSYQSDAAKPMVITGSSDFDSTALLRKFYNEQESGVMCTPRSNPHFACIHINTTTDPETGIQRHEGGNPRLDMVVKSALLNSAIGETVVKYVYKPKAGFITKRAQVQTDNTQLGTVNKPFAHASKGTYTYANNNVSLADAGHINYTTSFEPSYEQNLECFNVISPMTGNLGYNIPQPQVHIGMSAIPALNPSTEGTSFVNACVYYQLDCHIIIRAATDSLWTQRLLSSPDQCVFFDNKSKKYSQAHRTVGFYDGSPTTSRTLCDDDEDVAMNIAPDDDDDTVVDEEREPPVASKQQLLNALQKYKRSLVKK